MPDDIGRKPMPLVGNRSQHSLRFGHKALVEKG
jgi:hypothetical protein